MTERTINAERVEQLIDVFGSFDENIRRIEDAFGGLTWSSLPVLTRLMR